MNNIQQEKYTAPVSTQPKFLQVLARIASYVFHPVFMPVVMAAALYWLAPVTFAGITPHRYNMWLVMIALNTLFFPLLCTALLKGLGFIESIQMYNPKDRIIPLIATMIFYFWAYQVIKTQAAPMILQVLLLGSFWGVITVFMISIFYKVSMHTSAAGSMVGIIVVHMLLSPINMKIPLFGALVIAGIIGTARMILNAHKQGEIWLGYIAGFAVQLAAWWYLK
ncbi:hypothetical protein ACTHGU_13110 [Chitinophagaceae bacterium MMS25-I14]